MIVKELEDPVHRVDWILRPRESKVILPSKLTIKIVDNLIGAFDDFLPVFRKVAARKIDEARAPDSINRGNILNMVTRRGT